MTHRVELTDRAKADAIEEYLWIAKHSLRRAAKWYDGLFDAIDTLQNHPQRWPLAPESESFKKPIRQLLYGKRRHVFRILYEIQEDCVYVLHIRHAAREFLKP